MTIDPNLKTGGSGCRFFLTYPQNSHSSQLVMSGSLTMLAIMAEKTPDTNIAPFPASRQSGAQARELPNNLQAEQNFLGALLLDNTISDKSDLPLIAEHFYDPLHARIFETAQRIIGRGQLANPVTLRAYFAEDEGFGEDGPEGYLNDLVDGVVSLSEAGDYALTIYEAHLRRELIRLTDQLSGNAYFPPPEISVEKMIEEAEQHLFNLAEKGQADSGLMAFDKVLAETIRLAEIAANNDGRLSGLPTGLTDLNQKLGGLHRSDLLILAGRPGMGKTALATNIAFHVASTTRTGEEAAPVAFFSLEMAAEQLGTRILAEQAGIDSDRIRRGHFKEDELPRLIQTSDAIQRAPFFIDDSPALSVSQLASRARRMKRQTGLGLVVVDYLQLLQAQLGAKPENRVQEISNISRSLKALAKELDVPVLALSQLSRAVEQRDDKRPNLADLRESGSIEQDADVVMFVYREEYYHSKSEPEQRENESAEKFHERVEAWRKRAEDIIGLAEIIIAKQRHGPVGAIKVSFDGARTRFGDAVLPDQLPDGWQD